MKKTIYLLSILAVLLASCNYPIPLEPGGIPVDDQAATIVAQTLTAITLENREPLASPAEGQNLVPLASPTEGQNLIPLASPTDSGGAPTLMPGATSTLTPSATSPATEGTPGATILTVDANTNCREGPGTSYAIVIQLVPGTNYQMLARTADNKYWVVTEIGKSNPCWVPAEFSNAFGNVNLLPVTTPSAPTSAAGVLQPPTGLTYRYECSFNGVNSDITVRLGWTDRSNNEDGFRVYRDGALVAELSANTVKYTDLFAGGAAVTYSYRVSVFNAAGEALGGPISFSCQ